MPLNKLQYETSPYLLQHADNPVDWHAWKPDVLEKARQEDKPILVSIGYSTCHWCHVMAHESFEDEQVAAYMNEHFINIKVDREERPDVDKIYMEACQAINGSGGWPLNCFLTPEGKPYFAGTYYPPQPAYQRPSWGQVLHRMAEAWANQRTVVEQQADKLLDAIQHTDRVFLEVAELDTPASSVFNPVAIQEIYYNLREKFDTQEGGLGGAPKFPGTMPLTWLLDYYHATGDAEALQHVEFSLQKMIRGGIYDQLGGGFARYATDRAWKIPHFEKMLYDNALLIGLLSATYQVTGKELYATIIRQTLDFVERELTHPEGGFYSALDADTEGEEGKYYVWEWDELREVLGDNTELFADYYQLQEKGNWEGKNILWSTDDPVAVAAKYDTDETQLAAWLQSARTQLLARRDKRIRPGLDDKILLDWNALMITAYARAAKALDDDELRQRVLLHLEVTLARFWEADEARLWHTYKEGKVQYRAFVNDYAYLIEALLEGYSLSFDTRYLDLCTTLTENCLRDFFDTEQKMFYFTSANQDDLPMRTSDIYDSAVPNGGSTMVHNLQRLAVYTNRPEWQNLADAILLKLHTAVGKYPTSFARWARAWLYRVYPGHEIAVVGEQAIKKARALQKYYLPATEVMASEMSDDRFPLLADRYDPERTLFYVCRQYNCALPVTEVAEVLAIFDAPGISAQKLEPMSD